MCRPTYFDVTYAINPWMDTDRPVDHERATAQWHELVDTLRSLGHTVEVCCGAPGLPDMVFAANAGTVIGGVVVPARFSVSQRAGEQPVYTQWFAEHLERVVEPIAVNEGEGDLLFTGRELLAGTGFRTDPASHQEVAAALGVPVASLELVDPAFYHLDTALSVLDTETIAYYPGAFSPESQALLEERFPHAIIASRADAESFALNAVSDGANVVIPTQAVDYGEKLRAAGFTPVPVDVSEFHKSGGGPKCCVLTLRD